MLPSRLQRILRRSPKDPDGPVMVVPLYWITEWALGLRDGSTLPDKVVGITTDDGNDLDWIDVYAPGYACGPTRTSFRSVIQSFHAAHPSYPWYSPHVTTFVIASPVARSWLSPGGRPHHSTGTTDGGLQRIHRELWKSTTIVRTTIARLLRMDNMTRVWVSGCRSGGMLMALGSEKKPSTGSKTMGRATWK